MSYIYNILNMDKLDNIVAATKIPLYNNNHK